VYAGQRPAHPDVERALGAARLSLDDLLARADFVSLHCPLTPETHHLIDAARLARMKPAAILVNTTRGPVVDEAALAEALARGAIAGAGLDVYEDEPRVHPALLALERVVLAPHLGSADRPTREAMARLAVDDVLAVLAGRPPANPVR
jgi:glyoxylate reductase